MPSCKYILQQYVPVSHEVDSISQPVSALCFEEPLEAHKSTVEGRGPHCSLQCHGGQQSGVSVDLEGNGVCVRRRVGEGNGVCDRRMRRIVGG